MASALSLSQMGKFMKGFTREIKNMGLEYSSSLGERDSKDGGKMDFNTVMEN